MRNGTNRGRTARQARAAFDWSRRSQRPDGSWPIQIRAGAIEDANSDSNFCAYIATGVWHHVLITGDKAFAAQMWPVVHKAVDFVIDLQFGYGEISWARSEAGPLEEALLTGCASVFHSIRCALALAALVGEPQPEWNWRWAGWATQSPRIPRRSPRRSATRWTGTTRSSGVRCAARRPRRESSSAGTILCRGTWHPLCRRRPWVTGAETCELVMALDAIGHRWAAHRQFAAMQHLRDDDGSYWTGLVFANGNGGRRSAPPGQGRR